MVELLSRLTEIRIRDDRIASVHALRLVAGDLHGHRPRDAMALQVAEAVRRKSCGMRPGTPALFLHNQVKYLPRVRKVLPGDYLPRR